MTDLITPNNFEPLSGGRRSLCLRRQQMKESIFQHASTSEDVDLINAFENMFVEK